MSRISTNSLYNEEEMTEEWAARSYAHCPVGGGTHAAEYIDHPMATTGSSGGTL